MSNAIRCLIAVAALLLAAGRVHAQDLERLIGLFDQLEETVISVDYHQRTLEEVLAELDDTTEVPIEADWEMLRSIGVQPRQPISLRMQHAPVSTILAVLLLHLGDRFEHPVLEAWAGHVMLTTYRGTEEMRVTCVYDVRDLLRTGDAATRLRAGTGAGPDAAAGSGQPVAPKQAERPRRNTDPDAGENDNGVAEDRNEDVNEPPDEEASRVALLPPAAPETPGEELMMLVIDHVDPEAWMSYGGTRASISEREGVLVVSAPASIHRKCREVLAMLRQADPSALRVDLSVVDLPRTTLEHLARRFDFGEAPAAQAVLGSPEASLQWSGKVLGAVGEAMSLSSEEPGRRFVVEVTPDFDRGTGRVTMALLARAVEGEDRRELETSLSIPLRGGAAVLELPSPAPGATARLLVVVPRRQ